MRYLTIVCLFVVACSSDSESSSTGTDAASSSDATSSTDATVTDVVVESAAAEACEHMADGPFHDVSAAVDPASASDATKEHTSVRVALTAVEGGNGGTVTWAADEAGDLQFFLSAAVPLSITTGSGDPVEIEATADVTECGEVSQVVTVEVGIGTYRLTFGPTTESTVSIVAEHGGEHDEHGDEH